jgi:predicted lipoprotein with Yx(FWY)xxD motif
MRCIESAAIVCVGSVSMWLATLNVAFCATAHAAPHTASSKPAANAPAPARKEWTDDGLILVTTSGMTLYTNATDAGTPGKSACSSVPRTTYADEQGGMGPAPVIGATMQKSCTQKWPPYLADASAQPVGEFGLIDRPPPESARQWTYRGAPLYLSIRDRQPGDILGIGGSGFGLFGRTFRLATVHPDFPAGLKVTRREEGLVFIGANQKPIYTPMKSAGKKSCEACDANAFLPLVAPALAKVGGDWSIIDAGAGRRQYAFKGQPLYVAPDSLKELEIEETGAWEPVVFRKGPGKPAAIGTQLSLLGDVYTDQSGRTLYSFTCTSPSRDGVRCDDPGDPAGYWVALCGDAKECARRWRPYTADTNARPVGLWSVVDVAYPMFTSNPGTTYPPEAPRVKAWAYRGSPVYTYYEDKAPGDIWGDGVKWIGGSSISALQVPGRGHE